MEDLKSRNLDKIGKWFGSPLHHFISDLTRFAIIAYNKIHFVGTDFERSIYFAFPLLKSISR